MRAGVDERGRRYGALAKRLGEGDATRQRLGRPHQVSQPSHSRDDRRGTKLDQNVHPFAKHHGFVEHETEFASERGSEFPFHAIILCGAEALILLANS